MYVENLTEEIVTSSSEALSLILKGMQNRRIASTNMNLVSSRGHLIFSLYLTNTVDDNQQILT